VGADRCSLRYGDPQGEHRPFIPTLSPLPLPARPRLPRSGSCLLICKSVTERANPDTSSTAGCSGRDASWRSVDSMPLTSHLVPHRPPQRARCREGQRRGDQPSPQRLPARAALPSHPGRRRDPLEGHEWQGIPLKGRCTYTVTNWIYTLGMHALPHPVTVSTSPRRSLSAHAEWCSSKLCPRPGLCGSCLGEEAPRRSLRPATAALPLAFSSTPHCYWLSGLTPAAQGH
jgi:hypothetical protein